jgi:2'-5' RNA ligase
MLYTCVVERHRVFLAIAPDRIAAGNIAAFASALRPHMTAFRPSWIDSGSYHLTLHFFGEIDSGTLVMLRGELARLALPGAPFFFSTGLEFLPSPRSARVCAVNFSLQPATCLDPLVASLREIAGGLGLPAERRPWHAHLSLARLRAPGQVPSALRASLPAAPDIRFSPSQVILYESFLSRDGARYVELERFGFLQKEKPLY